jgi:antitoxin (DNA-binding transcriptional repressor) of toxin-antitoxin stability system
MKQINIHDAKTHLSALLEKQEAFIIAKSGKPVATVTPYRTKRQRIGFLKEQSVPDDFDSMGALEISSMFEESL